MTRFNPDAFDMLVNMGRERALSENVSKTAAELALLRERVDKLEQRQQRPRGVTGMQGAAEYLNRSREWLRQQHLIGKGPKRLPSGDYTYDALDEYLQND